MKVLMLVTILMLSGCVSYTNDKGQKCVSSVDPIALIVTGEVTNCYGKTN